MREVNVLAKKPLGEFLTVSEVAGLMRVSNMTIYRLIRAGDLSAVQIGNRYRIRESDVSEYLEENYVRAG